MKIDQLLNEKKEKLTILDVERSKNENARHYIEEVDKKLDQLKKEI